MSNRVSKETSIQCGIGGCRAPEVPDPIALPAREALWDESPRKVSVRKNKMPVYRYAY